MKFTTTIPLIAGAAAFVIPEAQVFEQIALEEPRHDTSSWWDVSSTKDDIFSSVKDGVDELRPKVEEVASIVKSTIRGGFDKLKLDTLIEAEGDFTSGIDLSGGHHGHHDKPTKTIYELLTSNDYTKKFAKAVSEFDDIVHLLNSTDKANYTLFAPIDTAFEHVPKDWHPSKEFIENAIKYHIVPEALPAGSLLYKHTLPTLLKEDFLNGNPQRLRARLGLDGLRLNFFSKVVAANYYATNGVVHGVAEALIPPPFIGRELALFPSSFSTLLYAYDKTDFVKFIHGIGKTTGTTMFAPSNIAWAKLGPRANAFLFNTEKGLKILKALLKYQISINETLYSDAYYRRKDGKKHKKGDDVEEEGYYQVDLPSLFKDKPLRVDVVTRAGGSLVFLKVNGYVNVVVQDGVAKNGVVHVVDNVPIPPGKCGHGKKDVYEGGEIEVEDLVARVECLMEDEEFGEL